MEPEEEVAQLDQRYGQMIAAEADDTQHGRLALEREQAKNQVWQRYAESQRVAGWRTEALAEFPQAFPGAVVGHNREEIMGAAKAAHEFALAQLERDSAARQAQLEEAAKQRLYGRPGGGGGGAPGEPVTQTATKQFDVDMEHIQSVLRQGTGVLTETEVNRAIQNAGDLLIQRQITGRLPEGKSDRIKEPS